MGYWESKNGVIGDIPADAMGDALDKIESDYSKSLGRKPTENEVKDILSFVMTPRIEDTITSLIGGVDK